jgi:hypothetical protein
MKKHIRTIALLLALLMLAASFVGCGGKAQTLLAIGDQTLSVNLYQLMLSIRKGEMAFAIVQSYGNASSAKFWDTVIDSSSSTYDDYYTAQVYEKAKQYLAAMALFDELGLTLPTAYIEAIESEMQALVDGDGDGSKQKLNSLLAEFGVNYDLLKQYKTMVKKTEYLIAHLYGADGSKIGTTLKEDYYKQNYAAFKQILLSNFYYLYKTDKYGDDIYYKEDGSIAYDTENATSQIEDGKIVYYGEDGKISYDKENGKRSPILDANGNSQTALYTNEQMLDRLNQAIDMRDASMGESAQVFESLRFAYSDEFPDSEYDSESLSYLATNVSYSAISASYGTLDDIAKKLAEMQIGEIAILQTDAGIHVLRKYPPETAAYADSRYTQWFADNTYGIYDFNTNLINSLLTARLADYAAAATVNTELLKQYTLKTSPVNFYYH